MLAIDDLGLRIGGRQILSGVTLTAHAGETLCLVGESGSGKSLTLLAAMRLLPRGAEATGRIRLGADDLSTLPEREMCGVRGRRIGMVFQEPMTALNPLMTIGAQVAETLMLHLDAPRDEALRLAGERLARAGLDPARVPLARFPHQLSGGQRQRVGIAIATALMPRALLADEPTTALDVSTQAEILALFRRLTREEGLALVLVTHDLAVAAAMADTLAVMQDGRIIEAGPAPAILRAFRSPAALALLSAARPGAKPPRAAGGEAPVLSAQRLVCTYPAPGGPLRAVDGVSLTVAPGETVGILGESGSGKSTLARALLRLTPVAEGRVEIGGADFTAAKGAELRRLRRRIQIVFQDPAGSFNPRHTAARIVAEPLHLLEARPDPHSLARRIDVALEAVGLSAADARKYPHMFSGGQRQRLAIARALITAPDVIVFDEAVSALDMTIRAQILALLNGLTAHSRLAALFITHDLGVLRAVADRVLVMDAGRIVEEGAVVEVLARPQHPATQALVVAAPDLDEALAARERETA